MYILFDIGASKMRIARAGTLESFDTPVILETPPTFEEGMQTLKETVKNLSGDEPLEGIAGGISGALSADRRVLDVSPNLPGWSEKPIVGKFEELFKCPAFVENDCVIVGLGEAHAGAGKGFPILAYLTVSTGVGGTRFVSGWPDASARGFEPGQQIIDADNTLCPDCEMPNTLEKCISGTAVKKRFGKNAYEIPQNDPLWEELAGWLSFGLANLIVMWSPDAIVLGGSMIVGDPAISVESVRKHLEKDVKIFKKLPEIKKAELGAIGGINGALVFLKEKLNKQKNA